MEINIQFVKITTDKDTLEKFAIRKLTKMAKKYDSIIRVDVFFKEEKDDTNKSKVCEIQLSLYGPRIFAASNDESYEAAVDETIKDLERQLKKRKGKLKPYM